MHFKKKKNVDTIFAKLDIHKVICCQLFGALVDNCHLLKLATAIWSTFFTLFFKSIFKSVSPLRSWGSKGPPTCWSAPSQLPAAAFSLKFSTLNISAKMTNYIFPENWDATLRTWWSKCHCYSFLSYECEKKTMVGNDMPSTSAIVHCKNQYLVDATSVAHHMYYFMDLEDEQSFPVVRFF